MQSAVCMISVRLESTDYIEHVIQALGFSSNEIDWVGCSSASHAQSGALSMIPSKNKEIQRTESWLDGDQSQLGGFTLTRGRHFGTLCSEDPIDRWEILSQTYFYLSHN